MCLLGIVGRPGVSWGILGCLGVSWGNIGPRHLNNAAGDWSKV